MTQTTIAAVSTPFKLPPANKTSQAELAAINLRLRAACDRAAAEIEASATPMTVENVRIWRKSGLGYREIGKLVNRTGSVVHDFARKNGLLRIKKMKGRRGQLTVADLAIIEEATAPIDFAALLPPSTPSAAGTVIVLADKDWTPPPELLASASDRVHRYEAIATDIAAQQANRGRVAEEAAADRRIARARIEADEPVHVFLPIGLAIAGLAGVVLLVLALTGGLV